MRSRIRDAIRAATEHRTAKHFARKVGVRKETRRSAARGCDGRSVRETLKPRETMNNRVTLAQLAELPKAELETLPLAQIAMLLEDVAEAEVFAKKSKDRLNDELSRRFAAEAQQMRRASGKDTGTVTLAVENGIKVRADLPKKVEWQQSELAKAVETIRSWGENPADYVSLEVKVSEARFNAWPPAIRILFEPARTVATGKPTFKVEMKEAA